MTDSVKKEDLKSILRAMRVRREKLLSEVKATDAAIAALTDICPHEWTHDGHDSHYEWQRCTICGEVEKV